MLHNDNLKTFFLFPQKLIFEELAEKLVAQQNEAYVLNNPVEFRDALKIFNSKTIAFLNIDSLYSEKEWFDYLKDLRQDPHFRAIRFGILSFNNNPELKKKYTDEIGLECGYHILSQRDNRFESDILKIVSEYREKEGHKVLRIDFDMTDPVKFEIKSAGRVFRGNVDALSSMAMSMTLNDAGYFKPAMELNDLTLCYRDISCRIIATVIGRSRLNNKQLIVKFQRLFEDFHQKALFSIIFHVLNNKMKEMVK